jgi:hypothetical protein
MAETKKKVIATRIEPAYIDILEIMASQEKITMSEFVRNVLIKLISDTFEGQEEKIEGKPSEFYFNQAQNWLNYGLSKLAAEKGESTLDEN